MKVMLSMFCLFLLSTTPVALVWAQQSIAHESGAATSSLTHAFPGHETWEENFLREESGAAVVTDFRPADTGGLQLQERLDNLGLTWGITPGGAKIYVTRLSEGILYIQENDFAQIQTHVAESDSEPGFPAITETTTVMGTSLTVEVRPSKQGDVTSDDFGGYRIATYSRYGLAEVADAQGVIVRVERDDQGRPARFLLGGRFEVRYIYSKTSSSWSTKIVTDLGSGRVLATVRGGKSRDAFDHRAIPPVARTTARLGAGPLVAEWDSLTHPEGRVVANLNGLPYALLPFEGGPPSTRIVWLRDLEVPFLEERIDYTADSVILRLMTDQQNGYREPRTLLLELPRSPVDRTWQDAPEDGGPDYLPGSNGGGSGGSGGGGGGENGSPVIGPLLGEVTLARSRAKQRVEDIVGCGNLFNSLNLTNGLWVLENTTYRTNDSHQQCRSGSAAAFTSVGSLKVYLCSSRFGALSASKQAAILIHEALHSAGMREAPAYPGELTSAQIQAMVEDQCGL